MRPAARIIHKLSERWVGEGKPGSDYVFYNKPDIFYLDSSSISNSNSSIVLTVLEPFLFCLFCFFLRGHKLMIGRRITLLGSALLAFSLQAKAATLSLEDCTGLTRASRELTTGQSATMILTTEKSVKTAISVTNTSNGEIRDGALKGDSATLENISAGTWRFCEADGLALKQVKLVLPGEQSSTLARASLAGGAAALLPITALTGGTGGAAVAAVAVSDGGPEITAPAPEVTDQRAPSGSSKPKSKCSTSTATKLDNCRNTEKPDPMSPFE
jgi:hypothetical protein